MDEDAEIIKEFLAESYEGLDLLERELLEFESHPEEKSHVAKIFRIIHSLKGTSGALEFNVLERVAHAGENVLAPLRDGELQFDQKIATTLLGMGDTIRQILGEIESRGNEGDADVEQVINELKWFSSNLGEPGIVAERRSKRQKSILEEFKSVGQVGKRGSESEPVEQPLIDDPQSTKDKTTEPGERSTGNDVTGNESAPGLSRSIRNETIRIDVNLLDQVMNLVGELVLARNQVVQNSDGVEDPLLQNSVQHLGMITSELQECIIKTRLQPISNAWQNVPRLVRDLGASCGKRVTVKMSGEETELDRTILETIKGPLTHIIRNAVDHGIESPAEREAAGKSAEGVIKLDARQADGQVIVEVSDDGKGIDPAIVRKKAIMRGLVTESQAKLMSTSEILELLFTPGFSTADSVTNVSGRGVGLDVAKTNIEAINGSLELQSIARKGSLFRMRIPLTLAIIPSLVVRCCEQRFIIPRISLVEMIKIRGGDHSKVEFIHDTPVIRVRGRLLPLVFLDEILEMCPVRDSREEIRDCIVVVVHVDQQYVGIVVDSIADTREIVVKPIIGLTKYTEYFSAATILGNGEVALILDVNNLVMQNATRRESGEETDSDDTLSLSLGARTWFVVFESFNGVRCAIPISRVKRLEELATDEINQGSNGLHINYQGNVLNLSDALNADISLEVVRQSCERTCSAVVVGEGAPRGYLVRRIIDIVEDQFEPSSVDGKEKLVVGGEVAELIEDNGFDSLSEEDLLRLTEIYGGELP